MKLPAWDDFDFTPLMWKELIESNYFRSKHHFYDSLKKWNEEQQMDWCERIEDEIPQRSWSERIRRILHGYALLDIIDYSRILTFRIKMWRLFEDLAGEIFTEALRDRKECKVVNVDSWPGFRGLDYIVINSESRQGWKVGIQCKRYITTKIPSSRLHEYSSWSRNVSSSGLLKKSRTIRQRFRKKKLILASFFVYKGNLREQRRFRRLKKEGEWDRILIFDKSTSYEPRYTYKLNCDGLEKILKLC